MMFHKQALSLATVLTAGTLLLSSSSPQMVAAQESSSSPCDAVPTQLICRRTTSSPTLDGSFTEWSTDDAIMTPLHSAMIGSSISYSPGQAMIACTFDDTKLYLALEFPAETYSFSTEDNHFNAAIATMFQVGKDATYKWMGGCPMASTPDDCANGGMEACSDYLVDIGGHWELKTTEQGVEYGINVQDGTGDDALANKDDEFAVSAMCRRDDEGEGAGNEWAGSWTFGDLSSAYSSLMSSAAAASSNLEGSYKFELSRLLTTESTLTDVQLHAGDMHGFGIAFWDPLESEAGWSDAGHYVSGCAEDWMDLYLLEEGEDVDSAVAAVVEEEDGESAAATTTEETDEASTAANLFDGSCDAVPTELICRRTTSSPTLDGSFAEWPTSDAIVTPLHSAMMGSIAYAPGQAMIACTFDDEKMYLALEFPAETYSFSTEDNHFNAAISTMFQVGKDASFYGMGGCPMASNPDDCANGGMEACVDYLVDIGGHWELKTTEQGVEYGINVQDGTGDDAIANKDDEFAVSPMCRKDDEGEGAGNEWAGSWTFGDASSAYTSLVESSVVSSISKTRATTMEGTYKFELSRLLTTESTLTDVQLHAGDMHGFGIAFWDPLESATGWSDAGHYVSGCAADWMDLYLLEEGETIEATEVVPVESDEEEAVPVEDTSEAEADPGTTEGGTSGTFKIGMSTMAMVAALAASALLVV